MGKDNSYPAPSPAIAKTEGCKPKTHPFPLSGIGISKGQLPVLRADEEANASFWIWQPDGMEHAEATTKQCLEEQYSVGARRSDVGAWFSGAPHPRDGITASLDQQRKQLWGEVV